MDNWIGAHEFMSSNLTSASAKSQHLEQTDYQSLREPVWRASLFILSSFIVANVDFHHAGKLFGFMSFSTF